MIKKVGKLVSLLVIVAMAAFTSLTYAQEQTYATLLKWETFNEIIKTLAAWHAVSGSVDDMTIKTIKRSNQEPTQSVDVRTWSAKDSNYLIKVWFDWIDTIYYYTQADKIYMNSNSSYLFRRLNALENLDLSGFDTSNVKNMQNMFLYNYKLTNLDLSRFNTSQVTNMQWMFNWCQSLTNLDLSSFNTSQVTNMQAMFYDLRSIEVLDLTSFDTSNVTNMKSMFANNKKNSTNLTTIYASNKFIIRDEATGGNMFTYDTKLVWWNWTNFNEENNDITYARIDKEWQPGYFTDVNNIMVKFFNIDEDWIQSFQHSYTGLSKWDIVPKLTQDKIERKTGYSLEYYIDSWMTIEFDFNQPITKYTKIYTRRVVNKYHITFVDRKWEVVSWADYDYGTPKSDILLPEAPKREWYEFIGWGWIPETMPAQNITCTAQWEEKKQSGSWYSGWWGHIRKSSVQELIWSWEKEDNTQEQETWSVNNQGSGVETQAQENAQSIQEWAYQNWLTKYSDVSEARLKDSLTRAEIAKLSSIFAIKVLWKTQDESKQNFCSQFDDLSKLNVETRDYVIKACELWYMWYKSNGIEGLVNFRPNSSVTVAEASVIVSRMIRWNQNAIDGKNWYKWHLYATYNHWLIDDIRNPYRNITRWEAFEMFYRISK